MMLDRENTISNKQTIAAVVSTIVGTDKIDTGLPGTLPPGFQARGSAPHYTQGGARMELLCQITTTVTSGGAATLQVQVIADDDVAMGSPVVLCSSAVIALATLVAGYQFRLELPVFPNAGADSRYLCAQYVIAGATTTAGNITTALVCDKQLTNVR